MITDADFDALLPLPMRRVTRRFWTPASVAQRVAEVAAKLGLRRILDVGSGPGKFCIISAAQTPEVEFVGIEQRRHLVAIAERLALDLGTKNASFQLGDATRLSWHDYDGLYVFNSFAENMFPVADRLDDSIELSCARYIEDILLVARKLAELAPGTIVFTYHGLGGPIPASYEPVSVEPAGTDWLHVWRQKGSGAKGTFWLEDEDALRVVSTSDLRHLLRSVARQASKAMATLDPR